MNFSQALDLIKQGKKLAREGWNGKDGFIFLVQGSEFEVNRAPLNQFYSIGTKIKYNPHIDAQYSNGSVGVWDANVFDILAEDWVEIQ